MPDEIKIRLATTHDLPEILRLFTGTVEHVARQDYASKQLTVWVASAHNQKRWHQAIDNQYFIVATVDETIAGFGSLDQNGYLDFLYVHKDYQRQGIAYLLYGALEQEAIRAGYPQITTDASKTIQNFFVRQGFSLVRENQKQIKGVELINYRMSKDLI
ncbi:GNAT family N-acetyltransferase [Tunicatimonas pelagia]|uniref:GNAT family N-acetyltransferase n=1 Tax=Tunicatimonas pelagia TaxID=931531 RepID=UPI0026660D58|nr:GNAT family N-acetyltransferase [Tunicatimonas pelagia]WKN46274.1 GNAT family N-acetyltransferase [Tunicatimonas pelagia]